MSDGADLAFLLILLILPLTGLIARRPPLGRTLRMALAWVAIFAVGLVLVDQRARFAAVGRLFGDRGTSGSETRIAQDRDGHFRAGVTINGIERRMLIDSGATTTALSVATAKAARITSGGPFGTVLQTANGPVAADRGIAARVAIGTVVATDLGVVIAPAFGDTDVIGMNFLSRLTSWRVEGRTLILTP